MSKAWLSCSRLRWHRGLWVVLTVLAKASSFQVHHFGQPKTTPTRDTIRSRFRGASPWIAPLSSSTVGPSEPQIATDKAQKIATVSSKRVSSSRIKGVAKKTQKAKKKTITKEKKKKKSQQSVLETSDAKKAKKKRKKSSEPLHWSLESDVAVVELDNDENKEEPNLVHFMVRGNPLPLRRHRTSRGFMYNPSAPAQASFRNVTLHILNNLNENTTIHNNDNNNTFPLFAAETPLILSILFRMKRPKSHFVGGKPGPGRLRETAPSPIAAHLTRTDVDNLAKFVLDSLNGVLYEDDRQVCSLHVTKVLDHDDDHECLGSTEVKCRPFTATDVHL